MSHVTEGILILYTGYPKGMYTPPLSLHLGSLSGSPILGKGSSWNRSETAPTDQLGISADSNQLVVAGIKMCASYDLGSSSPNCIKVSFTEKWIKEA